MFIKKHKRIKKMSRYEIIIRKIDEKDNDFEETILSSFEYNMINLEEVSRENLLDILESQTLDCGWKFMREFYTKLFELLDKKISDNREHKDISCCVRHEGYEKIKIISRLGILEPERQVCKCMKCKKHFIPLNEYLPEHNGVIVTRGISEWCCLLSQELPFASVSRLLGWISKEEKLLSKNTVRAIVKEEGELIRESEEKEVEKLNSLKDLSDTKPKLVLHKNPRRKASWPEELNKAVDNLLEEENPLSPEGVSKSDWERVLTKCKEKKYSAEELRKLGPEVKENQIIINTDEVLVRAKEKRKFHEIRTAKIITKEGYRYFSGTGKIFLLRLYLFILLCGGRNKLIILLGDGARWIKKFFTMMLKSFPYKELILDWYHLHKKVMEYSSMICRGKIEKGKFLASVIIACWNGKTEKVIDYLKRYESKARNKEKLKDLLGYINKNIPYIPDYGERRRNCCFNGSGQGEKANDLLVSKRQKKKGMHWTLKTSDSLAALKTLILNQEWDDYWVSGNLATFTT